jgi:hypothetical protein
VQERVLTLCMKSFFLPTLRPPSTTQQPVGASAVCRYKRWSELRSFHMSVMGAFKPWTQTAQLHGSDSLPVAPCEAV